MTLQAARIRITGNDGVRESSKIVGSPWPSTLFKTEEGIPDSWN